MSADECETCHQPLRVACPACGRRVAVRDGLLAAHETSIVHTGHITWGSCRGLASPHMRTAMKTRLK